MVDVVLAAHKLDLVPDRSTAVRELRRGPSIGGTRVVVTSGPSGTRRGRILGDKGT